jgi:hypothetical protein
MQDHNRRNDNRRGGEHENRNRYLMKTKTHTDRLWYELSRISAAATIAQTYIQALPDGETKTKLTTLHNEIAAASEGAMQCATDIKAAATLI